MANAVIKDLEIMFGEYVEGFDAACVISQEAEKSFPDPQSMQRAGDVFYRPQDFGANFTTGLDLSAANKDDVIQRVVPTTFRTPDNVLFDLDAKELRDPELMKGKGKAAALRLAGEVDKALYTTVANQASIFVKKVGALSWDDAATAEALMLTRGIGVGGDRKLFLNAFDYVDIAKDLGNRQYIGDLSKNAYERSRVPDIAGFKTFRTDNLQNSVTVGTVTGTTVNGNQSYTPTAMTGDVPTDNRRMTLTVQGANVANIKAGDTFTISNGAVPVNAVHNIDKSDTGRPMTFRVLAVAGGGTSLTITPPIVSAGQFQNVTAQANTGATIAFQNTATKPVNAFWSQGAVTLDYGRLTFPQGQGVQVMTATTKQGVPLIMSYGFNQLTAKTTTRFTTLYAATVLDPEKCGVIVANQT